MLTANVVLEKSDDSQEKSYSVFYGECFSEAKPEDVSEDAERGFDPKPIRQKDMQIGTRFKCNTITQFRERFPKNIDTTDIASTFQEAMQDNSNVLVHSIINIVVLFFKMIDVKRTGDKPSDSTENVPRLVREV